MPIATPNASAAASATASRRVRCAESASIPPRLTQRAGAASRRYARFPLVACRERGGPAKSPPRSAKSPCGPLHSRRSDVGETAETPTMANGLINELKELNPADAGPLPLRDVRSRSVRGALIRFETLRRLVRVAVLGVLDAAGVFLAIWTALELKAVVNGKSDLVLSYHQTQDVAPLAILVTLLLFARSRLYGDRNMRPGLSGIVASLFQATVVILLYAVAEGGHFSSYYIFYGSLVFALAYVSLFRWTFEKVSGAVLSAAGYKLRTVY